jgi:Cu2+-exporting ATPase/Cu+-exporting ATPase
MMEDAGIPAASFRAVAEGLSEQGRTPLYFAGEGRLMGVIGWPTP